MWLADIISSDSVSGRLTALAGGVEGLENFEDNRLELYTMSLSAFFKSPLFGQLFSTTSYAGGHSFILDSLASYGILGGTTLFFIYRSIYKFFFKPFYNEAGFGFVLWSFVQAIILSFVNTGMWINVLALFIPIILYLFYNVGDEENYESSLDS
ncbi:MAG: hypothetical protein J5852_08255 [Clostridia bacterium]|nr:hypothetical protein [Clostridia bacterium]